MGKLTKHNDKLYLLAEKHLVHFLLGKTCQKHLAFFLLAADIFKYFFFANVDIVGVKQMPLFVLLAFFI